MYRFDGIYVTEDLREVFEFIISALPANQRALLTFRSSGYEATVEYATGSSTVTITISADWARGYARRALTRDQLTDLKAELEMHGRTVWIYADEASIALKRPT